MVMHMYMRGRIYVPVCVSLPTTVELNMHILILIVRTCRLGGFTVSRFLFAVSLFCFRLQHYGIAPKVEGSPVAMLI